MELSRQYRQMLYRMSLYQTAKEQQLSVGTLPVLSQYHLTGGFRLFQKEHPEISLALTEVEESELMEGIEKKRFAMILARESMIIFFLLQPTGSVSCFRQIIHWQHDKSFLLQH